jgi:pSer/pThr/pTyr-binding forkhead associated (FHA) protein
VMPNERQLSRLVVIAPEWLAGQVIRVRSTRMTVGRGQTDVYLDDPQVSRIHAALIARDEQNRDLRLKAGNRMPFTVVPDPDARQPLRIGDVVGFGPVVAVVDSDAGNPSASPFAPAG